MVHKEVSPTLKRSPFRSTAFIALLLIVLVLAVQYSRAWQELGMVKIAMDSDLQRHLIDVGRIGEREFRGSALEMTRIAAEFERAIAEGEPEPALTQDEMDEDIFGDIFGPILREPFEAFAERARLENLTVLDPAGRVLFSTAEPERFFTAFEFMEIDREPFESALNGVPAGSPAYGVGASANKRVYVPLTEEGGSAFAVICLAAGRDYLEPLSSLTGYTRRSLAISTVLVLLIGWLVYRLIAQQRKVEQRGFHADRLSSLGSLAAGFAHEVRNPLEIITACTEELERLLRDQSELPAEAAESCRDILEEVDRLNHLVAQFLQYAKADDSSAETESTSLSECVDSVMGMLRRLADQQKIVMSATGPSIDNDVEVALGQNSLRQIIINLSMNAIQATPDGGRVELLIQADPKQVRISFLDSGPGVPPALRSKIFDPFFTTRDEGSGLGLSIAHQLAARSGARIECVDAPRGMGACFVLTLPLAPHVRSVSAGVAEAVG